MTMNGSVCFHLRNQQVWIRYARVTWSIYIVINMYLNGVSLRKNQRINTIKTQAYMRHQQTCTSKTISKSK
jgi:hypothetical protein